MKYQFQTLIPFFDELTDGQIIVRPFKIEDAPALYQGIIEDRSHLRPWLPFADQYQQVEEAQDFILRSQSQWLTRDNGNAGVFLKESGEFLGGIGFHIRNLHIRYFEVGYWLRISMTGKGYMTSAVRLVSRFLFEQLEANRVEIRCDARHTRSAGIARRLGFIQEASLRNVEKASDGTLRTMLIFALIPTDPARELL
jgi:RimJ/RimL family protein N-acetyltransferase